MLVVNTLVYRTWVVVYWKSFSPARGEDGEAEAVVRSLNWWQAPYIGKFRFHTSRPGIYIRVVNKKEKKFQCILYQKNNHLILSDGICSQKTSSKTPSNSLHGKWKKWFKAFRTISNSWIFIIKFFSINLNGSLTTGFSISLSSKNTNKRKINWHAFLQNLGIEIYLYFKDYC